MYQSQNDKIPKECSFLKVLHIFTQTIAIKVALQIYFFFFFFSFLVARKKMDPKSCKWTSRLQKIKISCLYMKKKDHVMSDPFLYNQLQSN